MIKIIRRIIRMIIIMVIIRRPPRGHQAVEERCSHVSLLSLLLTSYLLCFLIFLRVKLLSSYLLRILGVKLLGT